MIRQLLHDGLVWRGRQLLRPQGHHYRSAPRPTGEPIFVCGCSRRWLPDRDWGVLTRYDTFAPYHAGLNGVKTRAHLAAKPRSAGGR